MSSRISNKDEKSIFARTEVRLEEADKLPMVSRTPKTASSSRKLLTTQSFRTFSGPRKPGTSWADFFERNINSPKHMQSTEIQASLNQISQEIAEMYSSGPSTQRSTTAMTWQFTRNISKELENLEFVVLTKKKEYNIIHNDVIKKEKGLKELENELEMLEKKVEQQDELNEILECRKAEHNEVINGLFNEYYYFETLNLMLESRKEALGFTVKPVIDMRDDLSKLEKKISDTSKEFAKLKEDAEIVSSQAEDIKNGIEEAKMFHENDKNEQFNIFRHKEVMFNILQQEHKHNQLKQKYLNYQKKLQMLIPIRDKIEHDERLKEKRMEVKKQNEREEEKFREIQQATSISSVNDLYAYYQYLQKNETQLNATLKESLAKMELLNHERNQLNHELNEIILQREEDRHINLREIEKIEESLKQRNKQMDDNERVLDKLIGLVSAACGAVTRLASQVLENSESIDVKPRNVVKYLNNCAAKLEEKLQVVFSSRVQWQEESINTTYKYKSPPVWLKLSTLQTSPREQI
ncbi:unnamed protein product [Blepharisma stoltei]|uniref:Uncharacterized protein n=1 Tax=Blepharisma stoltei TaxID=1481888 RepID=A0AAU9JMY1_9CILI|nr:unnamed protein product [Blepharisma stoltei]